MITYRDKVIAQNLLDSESVCVTNETFPWQTRETCPLLKKNNSDSTMEGTNDDAVLINSSNRSIEVDILKTMAICSALFFTVNTLNFNFSVVQR